MSSRRRLRRILFTADNGVCVEMYRPLATRLAADPRLSLAHAAYLRHGRDSFADTADAAAWLRTLDLPGTVHHYRVARWLPFDALVTPSFNDRLDPRNARLKVMIFHGVSFKNYCIKEKALRYDRLYLPGEYHRRRYVESGLFADGDPRLRVVGLPKLDRLVDGTYRRDDVLRSLGLDPALPMVLFAPTGDRGNALSYHGEPLLDALARLPVNVVVKPHDHSRRDEHGIDWKTRLAARRTERFTTVLRSDIVPLLAAADLLVTDASSVAFEYALRDRPIVFLDVPEILEGPRAHRFDLGTWGRRAGHVVPGPEALESEVLRLLEDPHEKSALRQALAKDVFHEPGHATTRSLKELYADLELEPDAAVVSPEGPPVFPAAAAAGAESGAARGPLRPLRTLAVAAVAAAGLALVCGSLDPAAADVWPVGETETTAGQPSSSNELCIHVDPEDPSASRVIVADKESGLRVYALDGRETQRLDVGGQLHVDCRPADGLGGHRGTLVASTSASENTVLLHEVDPKSKLLVRVPTTPLQLDVRARGLCLYRRPADGAVFAIVVGRHPDGDYRIQHFAVEPDDAAEGGLTCRFVRERAIGGPAESCVADDDLGAVYVAEEGVGIWKYAADPTDETPRRLIDRTGLLHRLRGDVEGLALLRTGPRAGYLIASSQGSDDLVVYRRDGEHECLGRFELVSGNGVDGVTRTEGIDGVIADLGGAFTRGLLAAHDADDDRTGSNVKLVTWGSIADALALP